MFISPLLAFLNSPMDWAIVGIVMLLLFGNRLPSTMRSLGRGMVEFKKGMQELDDEPAPGAPARPAAPPATIEQRPATEEHGEPTSR